MQLLQGQQDFNQVVGKTQLFDQIEFQHFGDSGQLPCAHLRQVTRFMTATGCILRPADHAREREPLDGQLPLRSYSRKPSSVTYAGRGPDTR